RRGTRTCPGSRPPPHGKGTRERSATPRSRSDGNPAKPAAGQQAASGVLLQVLVGVSVSQACAD
ncbi:hypothetical protein RZS08_03565, partial [Arthrospira platensis SPKY1]|nr:hypothetical protein [Arthrospira platensis SPKY1]